VTLTLCFSYNGLAWCTDELKKEWFEAGDPNQREAFVRSIDQWLDTLKAADPQTR
jgi:hypothetical protein